MQHPHFDYVCNEVAKVWLRLLLRVASQLSFGVLTTDAIEQAIERTGTKAGNKGWDAAKLPSKWPIYAEPLKSKSLLSSKEESKGEEQ